jgi:hypothetical protein
MALQNYIHPHPYLNRCAQSNSKRALEICQKNKATILNSRFIFLVLRHKASFLKFLGHTVTRHSRYDSSRRGIGLSQRPLTHKKQHSHETNIHATGRIRTLKASTRSVAVPAVAYRSNIFLAFHAVRRSIITYTHLRSIHKPL